MSNEDKKETSMGCCGGLDRRKLLLGSSALIAAAALSADANAQAQPAMPSLGKCSIR
jgi:arylsulfatase